MFPAATPQPPKNSPYSTNPPKKKKIKNPKSLKLFIKILKFYFHKIKIKPESGLFEALAPTDSALSC